MARIEETPDVEVLLAQFNRLIQELLRGNMNRNTFRPWEIELLLDIEGCNLRDSNRREILRRYQKAVQRHVDRGATSLLKLSEYLERNRARRAAMPVAATAVKGGSGAATIRAQPVGEGEGFGDGMFGDRFGDDFDEGAATAG